MRSTGTWCWDLAYMAKDRGECSGGYRVRKGTQVVKHVARSRTRMHHAPRGTRGRRLFTQPLFSGKKSVGARGHGAANLRVDWSTLFRLYSTCTPSQTTATHGPRTHTVAAGGASSDTAAKPLHAGGRDGICV